MPKFLEEKLQKAYGKKSAIPYKIMNSMGAMRGNKETPKGAHMQAQHEHDMSIGSMMKGMKRAPGIAA